MRFPNLKICIVKYLCEVKIMHVFVRLVVIPETYSTMALHDPDLPLTQKSSRIATWMVYSSYNVLKVAGRIWNDFSTVELHTGTDTWTVVREEHFGRDILSKMTVHRKFKSVKKSEL